MIIRWDAPGPYVVAFSTRLGGVSEGAFASLNLGLLTDDRRANVEDNRRRLCAAVGADPEKLTLNRQVHGAEVHHAVAGRRGEADGHAGKAGMASSRHRKRCLRGDGLWTDEPGVPMLKVTADCLPVALARLNGDPGLCLVHAGWRGLAEGVLEAGVAALGGALAAVIGPGIGPCCYEVGPKWQSSSECADGSSTCARQRSGRSGEPASSASSTSTSAPPATPNDSSPIAGTAA